MNLNTLLHGLWRLASDAGLQPSRIPTRLQAPLAWLQALLLLGGRLLLAKAFFWSGLTKLRDWDTTLALFQDEYQVPLLSPELAAFAGTAGELLLPVLLVLGLGGRFAAAGLFVVNGVAVLSLAEIAPAALMQHQLWGALALWLLVWGPGRLSVDAFWRGGVIRSA